MSVNPTADDDGVTEDCTTCGHETPHSVAIEIRTESQSRENAAFSREPYRVVTCHACGNEEALRMNNA